MSKTQSYKVIYDIVKHIALKYYKGEAKDRAINSLDIKTRIIYHIIQLSATNNININSANILDIGCSKCEILLVLKEIGAKHLTGVNLFPLDQSWFSENILINELFGDVKNKIKYITSDIDTKKIPFDDSSFDIIIFTDVIEHINDPTKVIDECYRLLSKNGILVIGAPNVSSLRNRIYSLFGKSIYFDIDLWLDDSNRYNDGNFRRFIGHIREYTMNEIKYILNKHQFKILYSKYFPSKENNDSIVYRFYKLLEKTYPPFSYNMLIIGRKENG
jgi:SAM-dependent methyltransferase